MKSYIWYILLNFFVNIKVSLNKIKINLLTLNLQGIYEITYFKKSLLTIRSHDSKYHGGISSYNFVFMGEQFS